MSFTNVLTFMTWQIIPAQKFRLPQPLIITCTLCIFMHVWMLSTALWYIFFSVYKHYKHYVTQSDMPDPELKKNLLYIFTGVLHFQFIKVKMKSENPREFLSDGWPYCESSNGIVLLFQKLCWLTKWVFGRVIQEQWSCFGMFQWFSLSHYIATSWKKETVRQTERANATAWQTEGGKGRRILLWQAFHFLNDEWIMLFFPLSILWDFKALIQAEWLEPTIVWILNIHQVLSFPWKLRRCWESAEISPYI